MPSGVRFQVNSIRLVSRGQRQLPRFWPGLAAQEVAGMELEGRRGARVPMTVESQSLLDGRKRLRMPPRQRFARL